MKVLRYPPSLMLLFVLLFSVNLWAGDKVQSKKVSTEQNSASQTSTATEQKKSADAEAPGKLARTEDGVKKERAEGVEDLDAVEAQAVDEAWVTPSVSDSAEKIPSEAEYWVSRVDKQIEAKDEEGETSVDALYAELNTFFDHYSKRLKKLLRKELSDADVSKDVTDESGAVLYLTPKTEDEFYYTLKTLYDQRLRLLKYASVEARDDITGTDVEGVQELKRELAFLGHTLRYHLDELPKFLQNLQSNLSITPLPTIGSFLQIIIALTIFRYWRRWSSSGLHRMYRRLLKTCSKRKRSFDYAKFIWYFDQIKAPVAWFVLMWWLFRFIEDPVLSFFVEVGEITAIWVLLSWMGVLFINALISRSSGSLKPEAATLTLRSLRYFGIWIVFSGLNLDLISRYAGEGTLYEWVSSVNELLLLFLFAVIVRIWRPYMRQSFADDLQQDPITEAVSQNQKGFIGYLYSILGVGYLLRLYIGRRFADSMVFFKTGQQVLDSILDLEIAKAYQRQKEDPDAKPLPPELEKRLMAPSGELIKKVNRTVLKKLLNRANQGPGGAIVLVGETGGGKTVLLQRVARESEKKSIMVSCPKEGMDGLIKELARELHLEGEEPKRSVVFEELLKQEIEVLLIDNIHMLIRPYIGGQDQIDKLAELFAYAPNILCVLSSNYATWQYFLCARSKRILNRNALFLQPWSVDQITALIRNSCATAEIDVDFSHVIIPRQFDNSNDEDPKDRVFSGFMRILHGAAGGNPMVALGMWTKALYLDKSGQVVAHLPRLPSSEELDNANLKMLLVLRAICRSDIISCEDIAKSLQTSNEEVAPALLQAMHNQWVEVIDEEYYQLNWYWRRAIVRILARQNLMTHDV